MEVQYASSALLSAWSFLGIGMLWIFGFGGGLTFAAGVLRYAAGTTDWEGALRLVSWAVGCLAGAVGIGFVFWVFEGMNGPLVLSALLGFLAGFIVAAMIATTPEDSLSEYRHL